MNEKENKKRLMDRDAAARIQSTACKNNSGITPKNSFASRAMSAAYRNEPINSPIKSRHDTNSGSSSFQAYKSNSNSNRDSFGESMLFFGLGALAVAGGVAIYSAVKDEEARRKREEEKRWKQELERLLREEEERRKSCCEKWCTII